MSIYDEITLNKMLPTYEDYKLMGRKMEFWEESVEVSEDYYETLDPNGHEILKKFTCEEVVDFNFRKSIASPRNYMSGILNKYMSTTFKNPAERVDNDFYDNVDLLGSSMNDFMQIKTQEAAIYGASYMMPDSTNNDTTLSEAQKRQIGVRPFIRSIDNEDVVNYTDYLGHLQEIIITFEATDGSNFALYYDNENMARIELDDKGKVTLIGELYPHGFSYMPIIRILPFDTDESFVASGSLAQMTLNNLLSLEKTELFGNTFTRYFASGIRTNDDDDSGDVTKVSWGTNRMIVSDSPDAKITPLGADPAQAQSIRDSIKAEDDSLHQMYHLSATQTQDATQVPSGYSLVISRADFNSICSQFVKTTERAENTLIQLFNESEGMNLQPAIYSRVFIEASKAEDIIALRDILALPIDDTLKAIEIEQFRAKYYA